MVYKSTYNWGGTTLYECQLADALLCSKWMSGVSELVQTLDLTTNPNGLVLSGLCVQFQVVSIQKDVENPTISIHL